MPVIPRIAELQQEMTAWRRDIHQHPETAFEERRTSDIVARNLESFGVEVHRGLARTGVVGTLRGRRGDGPSIGLRADMDALHIDEKNGFTHRSVHPGKMHACGHDGHTAMLLGAARYLAETREFAGTVHFIFQPAEENEGGAVEMIADGLFDKFPMESVFGMHNMPGIPVGEMAVRPGPFMAAYDIFDIRLRGIGSHAAMPHLGRDPIVAGAAIVTALQTIASRTIDPQDAVVVSVTQFHAGDTWNVVPEDLRIQGTVRSFRPAVQQAAEASLRRIVQGVCAAHGIEAVIDYDSRYPATINDDRAAELTAQVMADVVGPGSVRLDERPLMASEDFGVMLQKKPGAYVWLGNGPGEGGCLLHNPHYDFNDAALAIGASFWARLVETYEKRGASLAGG